MEKINRVITALGNPTISKKLKEKGINILTSDIQYKEGIMEYLEKDETVNYIILDEKLPGEIELEQLIYNIKVKIKKVKIILISERTDLKVFKILKIADVNEIYKTIQNENIFAKPYIPINEVFNERTKEAEIITILGPNGIGKSIFAIAFANQQKDKKVLVIDFDILSNDLHSLLGVKKYSEEIEEKIDKNILENTIDIEKFIIHTKFNLDLISGINLIFNSSTQPNSKKIRKIILKIKNKYDVIIIDTSSSNLIDYTKELIEISQNIIFISGANSIEIKKSLKLLDLYKKECSLQNNKINIIFNKWTQNSIDDEVLRNIFRKYNILGKIKLSDYYDIAINKNNSKIPQIEKEIKLINKKYNKKRKLKIKKIKK